MDADSPTAAYPSPAASNKRQAFVVYGAAIAVAIAAAVPWGTIDFTRMPTPVAPGAPEGFNEAFAGMTQGMNEMMKSFGSIQVTMGNGHASFGGLRLPNALVLIAAGAAALATYLRTSNIGNVPVAAPIALAGYGLVHTGYVWLTLATSQEGTVGAGVVIAALAFAAMLFALVARAPLRRPRLHHARVDRRG